MGGSRLSQGLALAADTELKVVSIDKLATFAGITAAEIFLSPSSSISSLTIYWNSSAYFAWLSALASLFFARVNNLQALSSIVLQPLLASRATLDLNVGLGVRRLLIGGSPFQERCLASEVSDGNDPGQPAQPMVGWTPMSSAKTIKPIAAIALLLHNLTVVTRTIDAVACCGVRRPNPFQAG